MKILLTGRPGIGKSTVIEKFVNLYHGETYGILASEMWGESQERVGFQAVRSDGRSVIFAHTHLISSGIVVGEKYHVDVSAIDSFVVPELSKGTRRPGCVVLIDEIGRMQSMSEAFVSVVKEILSNGAVVLGSIIYDDEPWANEFKAHPSVVLVEVTAENRMALPYLLLYVYENVGAFSSLSEQQQKLANAMLWAYFKKANHVQVLKLVRNAIPYVAARKVERLDNGFLVNGSHSSHVVFSDSGRYRCDCPLFLGLGNYQGKPGECSHVQAVRLFVVG